MALRGAGRLGPAVLAAALDRLCAPPPVPAGLVPPDAPPLWVAEADFQALVTDFAGWLGWEHFHVLNSKGSDRGWPDLVLVRLREGRPARIIFRELKTERGKVSAEQARWGELLLRAGLDWAVWRPGDWAAIVATLMEG